MDLGGLVGDRKSGEGGGMMEKLRVQEERERRSGGG